MFGLKWLKRTKDERVPVQRKTFEELLSGIKTEEGRIRAILMAVQTDATRNPAHLDIAYNHYLQEGNPASAADVAGKKGDFETAAELYITSDNLWSARDIIGKIRNMETKNRMNRLLAEKYEKRGDYEYSAEFYIKAGDEVKFKEVFEKEINRLKDKRYFQTAAEFAKKYGHQNVADEICDQAITVYEEKGDLVSVAEFKKYKGDVAGARNIYLKLSEMEETRGKFREAAGWLRKAGEEERSEKLSQLACLLHGD